MKAKFVTKIEYLKQARGEGEDMHDAIDNLSEVAYESLTSEQKRFMYKKVVEVECDGDEHPETPNYVQFGNPEPDDFDIDPELQI